MFPSTEPSVAGFAFTLTLSSTELRVCAIIAVRMFQQLVNVEGQMCLEIECARCQDGSLVMANLGGMDMHEVVLTWW